MGKTVAILYGFTEGHWHGKRWRKALHSRGYTLTDDLYETDVVIGHSGGCYLIPIDLPQTTRVILIDPPYWPGKSLGKRGRAMIWQLLTALRPGNHPLYQLGKTVHNFWYMVRHARLNRHMVKRAPHYNLEEELRHADTILVRNEADPWLTPKLDRVRERHPHLSVVHMPGGHDHCWEYPEQYLHLLQSNR